MANKKIEVEHKEGEEKFKMLLDSARIGTWELDLVNDTAWRSLLHDQIFGYDHLLPEWGYEIFITHVIPEDREYVKQRFEEAYSKGKFSMECRIKRVDDNSIRWISAEGFVYKNDKGELTNMTGVVVDIDDRKKTEAHTGYLAAIVESSDDAIFSKSLEGIINNWNKGAEKMMGYKGNEIIGKHISLIIPPEYLDQKKMVIERILNNETIAPYETILLKKNDQQLYVSFSASPLKDETNSITGVSLIARDITERKKSEINLIQANKELHFQNDEKEKRAAELVIANKELAFQSQLKENRAAEKEKRAEELIIANKELAFQNKEKEKRAAELIIANKELAFQNDEKEKRASELGIANKELIFQNEEKEKRAAELVIANKELAFQNDEKEKRAGELGVANKELAFQNEEKEKRAAELRIANYARSLIEASLDPLVTINTEGKITDVNEASIKVTGIPRKKLIDTDFSNYFTEPEKAKEGYRQVFEKGFVADYPLTIKHKNGKLTDVLYNASVYKDDNGNVLGVFAAARDVTAQKLLSKYARSLIEASRDPLFTINLEGKITDMNNASVNIIGVSREKLIGTDFFNYFTEPDKARAGYKEVFAKGFVADYPLTIRDHKLTDVLFNGSVYKDEQGTVLGVVVVARDITEQKRNEKELTEAKIFAELSTGIAEEAKSKAEDATRVAEHAVKAKQQFLSNMSHEIRTPMNAIIGFTKVVLKTELTAKQKEYLTAIKMSGDALIVLINDILDLAKVDSGKMTFEQIPFKMSLSISAMLHLFETKIQEKNLKLVKEYDNKIPDVLVGDPVRLHQIILNLVSNAVKFTNKGKIIVSVKLLSEDEEKATIEFAVSDTGVGIPENKLGKIFENFQQASSGTSRLYGGTGLGLAIVKQLVEPQGGTISVVSKINQGSTFSFILSFQKTNEEAESESGFAELDTEIKNIKVLVVEDIALNQLLMKTLLDDFGFERDIAANGKIAIEKLESKSYDIILMDLQMPEMNGFECTEYIRNTMNSKIPIIALTADVTTVDLAKCKAVGMNDYIAKPVDEKLLYNKILGLVKKPSQIKPKKDVEKENDRSEKIKCIDLAYLIHRTKADPKLMMEMISAYLEQTPPLINSMKQSFQDKDWGSLHSAVHKMIPSFSIMGMSVDFENMAKKVQEYANTHLQEEGIEEMVIKLEDILEQSCEELEIELIKIKNTTSEK